uniref:Matrix protein n=1 Tax=Avulavirus sp. TaxID=2493083 RepID=A0A481XUW1_9MONO|nr:M [Avulavirus sp.] [Avulavirus sp.]
MLRAEDLASRPITGQQPAISMESRTVKLYVDPDEPASSLLAFPLIFTSTSDGKKTLSPQYRIQIIDGERESDSDLIFISTYGFISGMETAVDKSLAVDMGQERTILTSCMLPLGSIPKVPDFHGLAKSCLELKVSCKKAATNSERIIFNVTDFPPILAQCAAIKKGVTSCNASVNLKAPEKIMGNYDLVYKVTFVSLTVIPASLVYKVSSPVLKAGSSLTYSLNMSVIIKVDITDKHPSAKLLLKKDDQYLANLWVHWGLISAVKKGGKRHTIEEVAEKIRRLDIKIELVDLFGPSLIIQCKGVKTKLLAGFFSKQGTAVYPISRAAPQIGKLLWSQTGTIMEASVVIQGGNQTQLASTSDYVIESTKVTLGKGNSKYNPFRK